MVSIIIYTTKETLEHKKGLKEGEGDYTHFYWELPKAPKRLEEGERIYFACDGFIQGSFFISEFNPNDEEMILWNCDSWEELKEKIPTKSFQGFKYADKVQELNSGGHFSSQA